ncbi:3-deoxy-7-phosphoheptulonate synthase [Candidatus Pacearchaeota archaeon]|nr:3-deoxy-7-phosphoheptulonate synthase [Candidatus Pacearchaeota archaeon]
MTAKIYDENIERYFELPSPKKMIGEIPHQYFSREILIRARESIKDILDRKDRRKIIIAGPCSIHDTNAGLEYASRLRKLADETKDNLFLVMRTYVEKPRTEFGWGGLIIDPDLDNSCDIEKGIKTSRKFLFDVLNIGIPTSAEFVSLDFPQYIADFICWAAIGARTVEAQYHRKMASGLSMPVGIKNTTAGDIQTAISAIKVARNPNVFPGINLEGIASKIVTKSNPYSHLILRGGNGTPNYTQEKVTEALKLIPREIPKNIIIDCSHGNSCKDYKKQEEVSNNVLEQILSGNDDIMGIMLESNLKEGKQKFPETEEDRKNLKYGVSVTDACIGWEATEKIIRKWHDRLRKLRKQD